MTFGHYDIRALWHTIYILRQKRNSRKELVISSSFSLAVLAMGHYSSMALWHCGIMTFWHFGIMAYRSVFTPKKKL
jgi:hypothetical protein